MSSDSPIVLAGTGSEGLLLSRNSQNDALPFFTILYVRIIGTVVALGSASLHFFVCFDGCFVFWMTCVDALELGKFRTDPKHFPSARV